MLVAYSAVADVEIPQNLPRTCADLRAVDAALSDPKSPYFSHWSDANVRSAIDLSNACSGPNWSYVKANRASLLATHQAAIDRTESDSRTRESAQQWIEQERLARVAENTRQREANVRRDAARAEFNQANERLATCKTTKRGQLYDAAQSIIGDLDSKRAAKEALARERKVGAVSGMVDKIVLHDAGEAVIAADEDIREQWPTYKKLGGTAESPQTISRKYPNPCAEEESALESASQALPR